MSTWAIKRKEDFHVYKDGNKIAHYRFLSDAQEFVEEKISVGDTYRIEEKERVWTKEDAMRVKEEIRDNLNQSYWDYEINKNPITGMAKLSFEMIKTIIKGITGKT